MLPVEVKVPVFTIPPWLYIILAAVRVPLVDMLPVECNVPLMVKVSVAKSP
jgi:hypothetical protein